MDCEFYTITESGTMNMIQYKVELEEVFNSLPASKFLEKATQQSNWEQVNIYQLMFLYKVEFEQQAIKSHKKCMRLGRTTGDTPQLRKEAAKIQALSCICETKFNRLLKKQELGWRLEGPEICPVDLTTIYLNFYTNLEKGMRFAFNGNKQKADKYKGKLNNSLVEIWEKLKEIDEDENNPQRFSYCEPGAGGKVLEQGAAFEPILKHISNEIKTLGRIINDFC